MYCLAVIQFRDLMLSIDPADDDDEDEVAARKAANTSASAASTHTADGMQVIEIKDGETPAEAGEADKSGAGDATSQVRNYKSMPPNKINS